MARIVTTVGIASVLALLSLPAQAKDRGDTKWIKRWAPERNMIELGVYGGLMILSTRHELFELDPAEPEFQGFKVLNRPSADFGGRFGYYILPHLGVEIEGGASPTKTRDDDPGQRATLWTARGHIVGQIGLWSVTPFVLFGGGALGVGGDRTAVGKDVDPAMHWGGGLKFGLHRYVQMRLGFRDIISPKQGVKEGPTNHWEVLLGLTVTLGRKKDEPEKEPEPEPEAAPPSDRDGDGFPDNADRCPDEPGIDPDGCPVGDRDGDGFADDVDACPDEAGVEPTGCPEQDADGDGIFPPTDKCPEEPETQNGFEDEDGCPDEIPDEVAKFAGTLEGISFARNSAVIKKGSTKQLDAAIEVLQKYPEIRLEISGHTSSEGSVELNERLSQERADAVRTYLTENGISADRIETRGAGPHEPLDTNRTDEGRSKNRRIEFRILQ